MKDIYQILKDLKINYQKIDHPAVYTVEDAQKYDKPADAAMTKNLFLRNRKGSKHYLVVLEASKRADLKKLAELLNEDDFSFASPERLLQYLGLTPGSVSPFGLINDTDKQVYVVVDNGLFKFGKQGFHPNTNTATLVITSEDFKKFLEYTKNQVTYLDL